MSVVVLLLSWAVISMVAGLWLSAEAQKRQPGEENKMWHSRNCWQRLQRISTHRSPNTMCTNSADVFPVSHRRPTDSRCELSPSQMGTRMQNSLH